jgi:outer membrane lipoprotein-sorting protein
VLPRDAVIAFLGLMALGGCSSSSSLRNSARTVTPDLVQQSVRNNQERVRSLKGSGNITLETPEIAQSGSFELMLRKPDSVFVKLEGPFGIEVGAALLTRQDFFFYNSLQNRLISGTMNASNLRRILRVNLSFDELVNMITGGTFFPEDQGAPDTVTVEDDQFVLTYRHEGGIRRYWIDNESLLIAKIQHIDRGGRLQFEQRFANFRSIEGTSLPYRVRITQLAERRTVALSYSSIAINTDALQFTLDVPENAERIRVR